MRYKCLGKTGLRVSVIGQGTWAMGKDMWGSVEDSNSIDTIRKAVDCGINLIDTAPGYGAGHSEQVVGRAIKGVRDRVNIATKCGVYVRDGNVLCHDLTPQAIRKELESSLSRLDTDWIDLYLIHWPDPGTPLEDSLGELERLRRAGKFRYLGVSNFDRDLLSRAMQITAIDCIQPQFSLLSRENEDLVNFAAANGIGVLTYGSLAAGMLTGKITKLPDFGEDDARSFFYPFFKEPMFGKCLELVEELRKIAVKHEKPVSHVALNWVTQQEGVSTALVGSMMPDQVEENALAGSWELTAEELAHIDGAYKKIF
jgi:aryl-alcohol dehydrogenase-like predicted oxidoreductase